MTLFGPPVIFCTPNLADTKQVLLLVVQGVDVRLDDTELDEVELPRYRDMMQRLARDPVGQTRVFELLMRLFFIHVLGFRPKSLQNRRHARGEAPREWCTDGVAASSCAPGIMGPVLAFRGEVEAQGRGSLHPHILVWLVCVSSLELLRILGREPGLFRQRVAQWNVVRPGAGRDARNASRVTLCAPAAFEALGRVALKACRMNQCTTRSVTEKKSLVLVLVLVVVAVVIVLVLVLGLILLLVLEL